MSESSYEGKRKAEFTMPSGSRYTFYADSTSAYGLRLHSVEGPMAQGELLEAEEEAKRILGIGGKQK